MGSCPISFLPTPGLRQQYVHRNLTELKQIATLLEANVPVAEIARQLGLRLLPLDRRERCLGLN